MKFKKLFCFISAVLVFAMASCNGTTPGGSSGGSNTDSSGGESTETGSTDSSTGGGEEQSGYQVSEAYWTENITQGKYFQKYDNVTVTGTIMEDNNRDDILFELDKGNVHLRDSNTGEAYFEITKDGKYYLYTLYEGKWMKVESPEIINLAAELSAFVVPLPYQTMEYDSSSQAYRLKRALVTEELEDVVFKFNDGKIISIFLKGNQTDEETGRTYHYETRVEFKNYGTTKVTFPEASTPGGEDTEERFVNKELVVTSMSGDPLPRVNPYGGYVFSLFSDGVMEAIKTNEDLTVIGYIGTYQSAGNKAVLIANKMYDSRNAAAGAPAIVELDNVITLEITYDAENNEYYFVVNSADGGELYIYLADTGVAPSHYPFPGTEEDLTKYQVTEQIWEKAFTNSEYYNEGVNVSIIKTMDKSLAGKLDIDNQKLHLTTYDGTSNVVNDLYYQYLGNGMFDVYMYNSKTSAWSKTENVGLPTDYFDNYLGIVPGLSLKDMSFSSSGHYYYCDEYRYWYAEGMDAFYDYIKASFLDNKLQDFTFRYLNLVYAYNYTYGQVAITLPEVGGGEEPPAEDYSKLLQDKVFAFSSFKNTDGMSSTELEMAAQMYEGAMFSFFNDKNNTAESVLLHSFDNKGINNKPSLVEGKFSIEKKDGYYLVQITGQMTIEDGEIKDQPQTVSQTMRLYPENNQIVVAVNESGNYNQICAVYTLSDKKPTHFEYTPEEEPTSKWPAEEIAAAMRTLGINEVLPELKDASSVELVTSDAGFQVKCEFADDNSALIAGMNYISGLIQAEDGNGFTIKSVDETNYIFVLTSPNGEYLLTASLETKYVILKVEPNTDSGYPTDDIKAYLEGQDYTDELPSLLLDVQATYYFDSSVGALAIILKSKYNYEGSIEMIQRALASANFTTESVYFENGGAQELYFSPNDQFALYITGNADAGLISVTIVNAGSLIVLSETYPQEEILATVPDYIYDELPGFGVANGKYYFQETDTGFMLLAATSDPETAVTRLAAQWTRAGFTTEDNELFINETETIEIYVDKNDDAVMIYVDYKIHECEYTFTCDQFWIGNNDAVIWAWVWGGNYGEGQWVECSLDVEGEENERTYTITMNVDSTAKGCILVRFDPEGEIGMDSEGKWNQTDDIRLSSKPTDTFAVTFN